MPETPATSQPLRLSSRDYTGRDKTEALREFYGRELMRVELRPFDDAAHPGGLDFSSTLLPLGQGAAYVHCQHTPARLWRSPTLLHDGADDVLLTTTQAGCVIRSARGEFEIPAGGFALLSKACAYEAFTPRGGPSIGLQVPHAALARLVPNLEEAPLRLLPPQMPEPALAMGYAQLLAGSARLPAPLLRSALSHLLELMARTLSPAAPGAQPPGRDALDVPRLALMRRDILARVGCGADVSLEQIARLHRLTPRQVQRLFAREGTCFSDVVREARLARAHATLIDPRQRHRRVLEIALDSGFDDVSAFGRAFRRQFGLSPSEARGLAG